MKLLQGAIIITIIGFLFSACSQKESTIIPATYISDGMVLQQNAQTRLWGKATPGSSVTVETDWNCTFSATTRNDSIWETTIVTPKTDNKEHKITISTSNETKVISRVLIGELWMASGESAMEFPLKGWAPDTIDGGKKTIMLDEPDSLLRFYHAEAQYAIRPINDVGGHWIIDDTLTREEVSAIAYHFARNLRDSLKVPVGVLICTLGESRAESWISTENIPNQAAGFYTTDWESQMEKIKDEIDKFDKWLAGHKHRRLKYGPNGEDPYSEYQEHSLEYKDESILMSENDYSKWATMSLPALWSQTPLKALQGICWYIKTDTIPRSWVGKDLKLNLGAIDDRDVVYFNGYEVGKHMSSNQFNIDRVYKVSGKYVKNTHFTIAIRVINTGGEGGFGGCKRGRMRLTLANDATKVKFIDGQWKYRMLALKRSNEIYMLNIDKDEIQEAPLPTWSYDELLPTVAANGMLAPFKDVAVKGVIWYQGEHNEQNTDTTYLALNKANIKTFKSYLGNDISFYQLQAVPSKQAYKGKANSTSILGVRKAQYKATLGQEKQGTVSTMDLGYEGFHSPYKAPMGSRLARMALSRTYGFAIKNDAGPEPISIVASDPLLIIRFKNSEGMVVDADKNQFEVAGEDGEYYVATSFIQDEDIAVFSHAVPHPKKVRYAAQNMTSGTLKNADGLPSVSFEIELETK